MFLSLNRRIRWGYIIAFLLLLLSYFMIFFAIQRLLKESNSVASGFTLVNEIENLKSRVAQAESGLRGYVLTADVSFLKPYNVAMREMPSHLATIENLLDNSESASEFDTVRDLTTRRMNYLAEALESYQKEGFRITPAMHLQRLEAAKTMDSLHQKFTRLEESEKRQMAKRKSALSEFFSVSKVLTIVSLVIAMLAIFFSWLTYNHESKAKMIADEKAEQYKRRLESNVQELKQANQVLQELKSIEKFAATGRIARTIAHEVRNPLTNISLAADQIRELIDNNPDSEALLGMVSRNANRINQLVSDLLNATRFLQLDFREIAVNDLVEQTLDLARDRVELNNIKVEKHFTQEHCLIRVDIDKMKLALLNIIVNAIEAMEKNKGVLVIRTKKQGESAIIEIRDNGKGMDEEMMQRLFEPYFTAKPDGNGLGLTNTQNIILNHKGRIKAYSKLGQGSTFLISLNLSN